MATSYYELLKRPEWQKKRLEIMERAGFKCEECKDGTTALNVHHRYYEKGKKPWEYEDGVLVCLCESCHQRWHDLLDPLRQSVGLLSIGNLIKMKLELGRILSGRTEQTKDEPQIPEKLGKIADGSQKKAQQPQRLDDATWQIVIDNLDEKKGMFLRALKEAKAWISSDMQTLTIFIKAWMFNYVSAETKLKEDIRIAVVKILGFGDSITIFFMKERD